MLLGLDQVYWWRYYGYNMIIFLNIDVVLFGSCSHVIMMIPKVNPPTERGARMWNRDRLRNRMSLVKNSNDISKTVHKMLMQKKWILMFWNFKVMKMQFGGQSYLENNEREIAKVKMKYWSIWLKVHKQEATAVASRKNSSYATYIVNLWLSDSSIWFWFKGALQRHFFACVYSIALRFSKNYDG